MLNDILDVEADRGHPIKRHRPFASGALSPRAGYLLALTLVGVSLVVGAALVAPGVLALLLLYIGPTTAYSACLKRIVVLDVLLLASLRPGRKARTTRSRRAAHRSATSGIGRDERLTIVARIGRGVE